MSDQMSDCIVGIQQCGCITYANSEPDKLRRDDERAIARIIKNGGRVERMSSEALRGNTNFLPWECPHDPKGWEHQP